MRTNLLAAVALLFASCVFCSAQTNWQGLIDRSAALRTDRFSFTGTIAEAYDGNENYYDGDMGDFDGDGLMDRALGARFGLLKNTGAAIMTPYASAGLVNYLFRGVSPGWGEDAFQWSDVDNDNDLDILQGGNGELFTLQINSAGRFRTKWVKSGSALNIVNTDIEKDGDVDLSWPILSALIFHAAMAAPRRIAPAPSQKNSDFGLTTARATSRIRQLHVASHLITARI